MDRKDEKQLGKKIVKFSIIFFILSSIIATQYFAHYTGYNRMLGGITIFKTNYKIYFPFSYFFWQEIYRNEVPNLIKRINNYYYLSTLLFFILLLILLKGKSKNTVHGSARWANNEEMRKMDLYRGTGVVLGCDPRGTLLHDNSDRHLALFAPTRMGKGINSVTPTCYDWLNSMVINDIKGELWGLTAGYRKDVLKQKVFMYCPIDTDGISCSYNPLDFISIGTSAEFEDVSIISKTLIDVEGKGDSDHWITSAINLLNGVLLHVKYANKNASLTDVVEFISPTTGSFADSLADILGVPREDEEDEENVALRSGCTADEIEVNEEGEEIYPTKGYAAFDHLKYFEDKDLFKKIYKYKGTKLDLNAKLHPLVAKEFMSIYETPDKERGSIISTLKQKLKIFMDPVIADHIRHSDFTIKQLMEEKCTLYLVTPPKSIARTKPILRLVFTQVVFLLTNRMKFDIPEKQKKLNIFSKISENFKTKAINIQNYFYPEIKKSKNSILLLIDEFPSLGKLDVIEESMSYIAGYGLKTFLISQSLQQFKKIYGKDNYILDNCSIQLYLTPNDPETPKMLSETLGKYTVKTESWSKKGMELMPTKSISWIGRELMTASEIRTLPYEEILLFITGQNPIKGKKLFYYDDERYKNKKLPAPKVSDKNNKEDIEIKESKKEKLRESIKEAKKLKDGFVIIADDDRDGMSCEEQLAEIQKSYETTNKFAYAEMLTKKFEIVYKYSLGENVEKAKEKFFSTKNIKEISAKTNKYLEEDFENIK